MKSNGVTPAFEAGERNLTVGSNPITSAMDINEYKKELLEDISFIYMKYQTELNRGRFNVRMFNQLLVLIWILKIISPML